MEQTVENNYENVLNSISSPNEDTDQLQQSCIQTGFSNETPNMENIQIVVQSPISQINSTSNPNQLQISAGRDYHLNTYVLIDSNTSKETCSPKSNTTEPTLRDTHDELNKKSEIKSSCDIPNVLFQRLNTFHNIISSNGNSLNQIAVEQPPVNPSSCFICGQLLTENSDKFSYMLNEKLFRMQLTLLQLLSLILNQRIITNVNSLELCNKCSSLINDIDYAFKLLDDLREQIARLFSANQRPKLTYQFFPKSANLEACESSTESSKKEFNLGDLSLTTPRRGRHSKKSINKKPAPPQVTTKKKNGRPRKPFQCSICKRKFLTEGLLEKHLVKEHSRTCFNRECLKPCIPAKKEIITKDKPIKDNPIKTIVSNCNSKVQSLPKNADDAELKIRNNSLIAPCKPLVPLRPKISTEPKSGLTSSMRPIQPKPETVVQTSADGSLVLLMNPLTNDAGAALIKVSPGYFSTKEGGFFCYLCNKTFIDKKSYRLHRLTSHKARKKNSTEMQTLKSKVKSPICKICRTAFSTKEHLLEHCKLIHSKQKQRKERIYTCEHCSSTFNYKYQIESHRESHLPFSQVGPHEFICSICNLKVASKPALKIHFHRFHNRCEEIKDFLCSECGYSAATKRAFSDHLRTHIEIQAQKAKCHICKKEMLATSFKIHMLRMHGEAKHCCEICSSKFALRSDLMRHINTIHSNLKPYDCSQCNLKFVTAQSLRYHRDKIHSTTSYPCNICGKCCKWKGELRTHMNRFHRENKERYTCSMCSLTYTDKQKLKRHMVAKHNIPKDSLYSRACRASWANYIQDNSKSYYKEKEANRNIEEEEKQVTLPTYESETQTISVQDKLLNQDLPRIHSHSNSHLSQVIEHVQNPNLNNFQVYDPSHPDSISFAAVNLDVTHQTLQPLQEEPRELHSSNTAHSDASSELLTADHLHQSPGLENPMSNQTHDAHTQHLDTHTSPLEGVPSIYLVSDMNMITMQDDV